jgi:hypothetical protein
MVLSVTDEMKLTKELSKTLTREQVLSMADQSKALEIIGGVRRGDKIVVPLSKAAECLGVTEEEARPIMEGLQVESCFPGWADRTGEVQ